MPINIYKTLSNDETEDIAWLCNDNWDLTEQMKSLELWLIESGTQLPVGDYIADVGISVREGSEAKGGGAAFPPEAMSVMATKGIYLFISEYPKI
ncbi:hypothetical protein [Rubritalea marina]|uniref:hypothetical protein n=1 Tax=Rubritalea marina TaxID=361055 RepID=UPI00036A7D84|nr:hypothetical protein [Rubritalea marina]